MTGTAWEELRAEALACSRCRLAEGRTQVVFGVGDPDASLMFVGEAPGFHEDRQGEPFVGKAGQLLDTLCAQVGLSRQRGVYIANVLKCRPPGNRDPEADEIASCRPFLRAQIELVDPAVIVTLGAFATRLLLEEADPGPEDPWRVPVGKVAGYRFHLHGRTLIPTFHPAAALRGNGQAMDALRRDLRLAADVLSGRAPTAAQALGLAAPAPASAAAPASAGQERDPGQTAAPEREPAPVPAQMRLIE